MRTHVELGDLSMLRKLVKGGGRNSSLRRYSSAGKVKGERGW
jgi:hypothetical protein